MSFYETVCESDWCDVARQVSDDWRPKAAAMKARLMPTLRACTRRIDVTHAAEFYFHGDEREYWELADLGERFAAPAQSIWMEYAGLEAIISRDKGITLSGTKHACGVHWSTLEADMVDDSGNDHQGSVLHGFLWFMDQARPAQVVAPFFSYDLPLTKDGAVLGSDPMLSVAAKDLGLLSLAKSLQELIKPTLLALGRLNAGTMRLSPADAPVQTCEWV